MWRRGATVLAVATLVGACGGGDGTDLEAFCARAADTGAFEAAFADLDPTQIDETVETFTAAREAQRELRGDAPARVRRDLDVLIGFVDDLVERLEAVDRERGDARAVYEDLASRFDAVESASDRLALFVRVECG